MFPSFLITFRETLEVSLIIGIVLGYLNRTKQNGYRPIVYLAIAAGLMASGLGAILLNRLGGGFTGRAEQIFEGVTALLGAALLTTMILWVMKQGNVAARLQQQITIALPRSRAAGLVTHGVHEFQGTGLVPVLQQQLWDINPPLNADGSYPLLHEQGQLGSLLKGLVGYNGNPTAAEGTSYLLYLILAASLWYTVKKQR